MNTNKKKLLIDAVILLAPVVIILLLTPILPDRIPYHFGLNGNKYINKKYAFLLGALPYIIYKLRALKKY